jgi:hypothetical protein
MSQVRSRKQSKENYLFSNGNLCKVTTNQMAWDCTYHPEEGPETTLTQNAKEAFT